MNKIIKKQLEKITSCNISFDDNTTTIFIPKTTKIIQEALLKNSTYIIKLNNKALTPLQNSTLVSNWNNGKIPNHEYYKVELLDVINDMYKFNGIAVENGIDISNENWYGWFPKDYFEVIEKVVD